MTERQSWEKPVTVKAWFKVSCRSLEALDLRLQLLFTTRRAGGPFSIHFGIPLSSTFSDAKPKDPSGPVYKTDKGRVVTGGGGIQPDVRVSPASYDTPGRCIGCKRSSYILCYAISE